MGGNPHRLRERDRFARNCTEHGVSEGTVLARAKREGWSRQVNNAKALAKREDTAKAITPFEAPSASMRQRGERHLGRMANIVEKTMPHVGAMEPDAILDRVDDVGKLDKVARRTFGISDDGLAWRKCHSQYWHSRVIEPSGD
jgi:hypothetical protein